MKREDGGGWGCAELNRGSILSWRVVTMSTTTGLGNAQWMRRRILLTVHGLGVQLFHRSGQNAAMSGKSAEISG